MAVRLGIVGFGSLVESHLLPAIRAAERFEVAAVAEPRPGAEDEIARLVPEARHVADHLELAAGALDAVVVAAPNHLHGEVARHFLENGVHVFCEKPLGVTAEDARATVEVAQRSGSRLLVGHVLRYAPAARFAHELVGSGLLGAFRYLACNQGTSKPIRSRSGYHADRDRSGGGVVMDKAIHLLDLFEFLLGELEVRAARLAASGRYAEGLEDEVAIELTAAGSTSPSVYVVSRVRKLDGRLALVFERGDLHLNVKDFSRLTFSCPYGVGGRRDSATVTFPPTNMFEEELRHLADVVENGAHPEADATAGLRAVEHVESIYRLLGLDPGGSATGEPE